MGAKSIRITSHLALQWSGIDSLKFSVSRNVTARYEIPHSKILGLVYTSLFEYEGRGFEGTVDMYGDYVILTKSQTSHIIFLRRGEQMPGFFCREQVLWRTTHLHGLTDFGISTLMPFPVIDMLKFDGHPPPSPHLI